MYLEDNSKTLGARFLGLGFGILLAGVILYGISQFIFNTWDYLDKPVKRLCGGSYDTAKANSKTAYGIRSVKYGTFINI